MYLCSNPGFNVWNEGKVANHGQAGHTKLKHLKTEERKQVTRFTLLKSTRLKIIRNSEMLNMYCELLNS